MYFQGLRNTKMYNYTFVNLLGNSWVRFLISTLFTPLILYTCEVWITGQRGHVKHILMMPKFRRMKNSKIGTTQIPTSIRACIGKWRGGVVASPAAPFKNARKPSPWSSLRTKALTGGCGWKGEKYPKCPPTLPENAEVNVRYVNVLERQHRGMTMNLR